MSNLTELTQNDWTVYGDSQAGKLVKFRQWKEKINQRLLNYMGLSSEDLPDQDYWSMFEDGLSSFDAANMICEELDI